MKKLSIIPALFTLSYLIYGCTLDSPLQGSPCGVDEDTGLGDGPAYIQLEDDSHCTPENCISPDDCCGIKNIRVREFAYNTFKYKRCPENAPFSECESNGEHHYCGLNERIVVEVKTVECESAEDCIKINPSITKAECESSVCHVFECETDYHVVDDINCRHDDSSHCGSETNKCDKSIGEICENGVCKLPDKCKVDSDCLNQVILNAECENNTCKINQCAVDYYLDGNTCHPNDNDNCGSAGHRCDAGKYEVCYKGACSSYHEEGEIFCGKKYVNPQTDNDFCGAKGECNDTNPESDNYSGEKCTIIGQSCQQDASATETTYSCQCNEHENICKNALDQLQCIQQDSPKYCGCTEESAGMDCTKLSNINQDSVNCENDACQFSCASGYGNCNNIPDDGCETSIINNPYHCGKCGTNCYNKNYTNYDKVFCDNQTCNFSCAANLTKCGNTCTNLSSDPNNCGSCENHCETIEGSPKKTCQNGKCTLCASNQTVCKDKDRRWCADLNNDLNNCGECGHFCDPENQYCHNGQCILKNGVTCIDSQPLHIVSNEFGPIHVQCIESVETFCNAILQSESSAFIQVSNLTFDVMNPMHMECLNDLSKRVFSGIYLGNGKSITINLINQPAININSLFHALDGATIENLTLNISFATDSIESVGALAISAYNDAKLRNVHVNAAIYAPNANHIGGLIGEIHDSHVVNSSVMGTIEGKTFKIDNEDMNIGGLFSVAHNSTIVKSNTSVSINGYEQVGGLIGIAQKVYISNCSSIINIDANSGFGGLIGVLDGNSRVINSSSTIHHLDINHYIGQYYGGLIGRILSKKEEDVIIIHNNHVSGEFYCSDICGGLIGDVQDAIIANNFVQANVSYQAKSNRLEMKFYGGLIGLSYSNKIFGNYIINTSSFYGEDNHKLKLDDIINNGMTIAGFIGFSAKNDTLNNNYAIDSTLPYFTMGDLTSRGNHNAWYINYDACKTRCNHKCQETCNNGSESDRKLTDSLRITQGDYDLLINQLLILTKFINEGFEQYHELPGIPKAFSATKFIESTCFNIFDTQYKPYPLPVLPDLMPDTCQR